MSDLAAFQRAFLDAVASSTGARGPLSVYLNTSLSGSVDALAANYPVTCAIVGEEMFRAIAADHAREHPPRTPVLALYGDRFPTWIAAAPWSDQTPYLADVARLERLYLEALFAADAPPLAPDALSQVAPSDWLDLRLALHPALRFVLTDTPAFSIWRAHQSDTPGDIEPVWGPEATLFTRPGLEVEAYALDEAGIGFLAALRSGSSLGDAAVATAGGHPGADVGALLRTFLEAGVFAAPPPLQRTPK